MQSKGAGPVNRVELESQVLCAALRQSCHLKDRVGAFTSVRELSHLFPDLLPPPEKHDEASESNKANYYSVLGVRPQTSANGVISAYLRSVRAFLRTQKAPDSRVEYNRILNAGFILRKPRLRLSHDLVVARRWLHEESRLAQIAQQEVTLDRGEALKVFNDPLRPKAPEPAPAAAFEPPAPPVPPPAPVRVPDLITPVSPPVVSPEPAPPSAVPPPPVIPAQVVPEPAPHSNVPPMPPLPAVAAASAGEDGFKTGPAPERVPERKHVEVPPMPPLPVGASATAELPVIPPVPALVNQYWEKQQEIIAAAEQPVMPVAAQVPLAPAMAEVPPSPVPEVTAYSAPPSLMESAPALMPETPSAPLMDDTPGYGDQGGLPPYATTPVEPAPPPMAPEPAPQPVPDYPMPPMPPVEVEPTMPPVAPAIAGDEQIEIAPGYFVPASTLSSMSGQQGSVPETPALPPEPVPSAPTPAEPPVAAGNGGADMDTGFPPVSQRAQQAQPRAEEPAVERASGRISKEAAFVFDESALAPPKPVAKNLPVLIQLLEAAQFITAVEVQALLAQMAFAPNIPVEKLILNAGYINAQEMSSVKLGESLLQSGKITMAQFQVAIYDERTSGLRMAESLQVRGWLNTEVRNAIDEFHKKRT